MKTTKKTSIDTQSLSLWEKVAGIACRMRVIRNITNSHQLKDSSRWSQPASLIGIDHSRLNPLMAISPILIFAFLLPLSFNLLTGATALAVAPTIGLSILATDGNTDNNITIQSPSGGGIAVGRHTLVINTNSYKGYNVTLNSNTNNSNLTNTNGNNSNNNIVPVAGTLTNPTSLTEDNTWGVAIPGKPGFGQDSDYTSINTAAKYAAVPASSTTTNNSILTKTSPSNTAGDNQPVVYGVKTASLTKAGSYQATVTYTATAQLPAKPTITSITPNSYQLGTDIATNPNASKITIAGTDLGSTNEVYIDTNGNSQKDTGEECTNLQVVSDTEVTCNVPTASTINSGTYDVTVTAQGGETTLSNGFTYKAAGIPVESITIVDKSGYKTWVGLGMSIHLSAVIKPENATDKSIKWSSSDTNIATVDNNGTVTFTTKSDGVIGKNVTITAAANNGISANITHRITLRYAKAVYWVDSTGLYNLEVSAYNGEGYNSYKYLASSNGSGVITCSLGFGGGSNTAYFQYYQSNDGKWLICRTKYTSLSNMPKEGTLYVSTNDDGTRLILGGYDFPAVEVDSEPSTANYTPIPNPEPNNP